LAIPYFEELLRYLDFCEADKEALRALHPIAEPHFKEIADAFYSRVQMHPNAASVLRGEAQVLRLKATLQRWMDRLLAGPWDDDYYHARARIGRVHVDIKLPQQYMFTAMGLVQSSLHRLALQLPTPEPTIAAIDKITNIDLSIMLESYSDDFVAAIRSYERARQDGLAKRLAVSEARYLAIFENASAAIVLLDGDRCLRLVNRYLEESSEHLRTNLIGMKCSEVLCHPSDSEFFDRNVDDVLAGKPVEPFEARILTANHEQKWFRWHLTHISAGDIPSVCAIGIEVTQEHDLAARTRRAETLAALGTLAAGLAHEIRNPLNAAQLQLMLVDRSLTKLGDQAPERALNASKMVRDELGRLAGLVEDFLSYARPSSLRIENVDVGASIAGVLQLVLPDASARAVDIVFSPSNDVVARIDEERLKQVMLNLIRNAIEAAREEGRVEVRCRRVAQSVIIEVRDNGPAGIPTDIDIFEPFATSKEGGTGLGLPIVHRIVTDHGGEISVSRPGDWTVFTIELPVDGPPLGHH
jgi:PAS domain S-box-containing protein